MAFLTKSPFPEFNEDQINQAINYMKSGKEVGLIENDNYKLIVKDDFYALQNTNDIIFGWIKLTNVNIYDITYSKVDIIYILSKYRKSKVLFLLIHAIRELIKRPIIIDDVIFNDGKDLILSLIKRPDRFKTSIIDKSTGIISDLKNIDNIKLTQSIIIENEFLGLYVEGLPGSHYKSKYSIFEEYHSDLK